MPICPIRVALLRGELESPKLKAFWHYAKNPDPALAAPDDVAAYSALMADSQAMVAREVLDAYDLHRHRRLLDIGGGEGAFLLAAGARHAHLDLMLFDLPAVAARAAQRFAAAGMAARASVTGGDFFRDGLPQGADIVSLVRVLHDHDEDFAVAILRRAHTALPKGGDFAAGGTDVGHARGRARRRRLFRILSRRHGQRPASYSGGNFGPAGESGFPAAPGLPHQHTADCPGNACHQPKSTASDSELCIIRLTILSVQLV